jgi:tripeptidyl-peptidase-1
MRYHTLSILSVLAVVLFASPATPLHLHWGEMLVKHKWIHIPDNWLSLGHPPDGATIDLHIALKPDRENALINALQEVSQPRHPRHVLFTTPLFEAYSSVPLLHSRYGAYLTKEQVSQLVAPHPDTLKLVSSWLKHNGMPPSSISLTHGGSWLTVAGVPVSQANILLGASYQLYYHPGTNETIIRTVGYAIPAALHVHIRTIAPTTAFTSTHLLEPEEPPRSRSGGSVNATWGEPMNMLSRRQPPIEPKADPSLLRSLYNTVTYSPVEANQNMLGIVGFRNEYPGPMDVLQFLTQFRADATGASPAIEVIDDRYRIEVGMQANLDVQYTLALTYPTPVVYYVGTGNGVQLEPPDNKLAAPGDVYLQWLNYMAQKQRVPQTIALGYSTPEPSIPLEYATALCTLFMELGVRGTSILVASGNAGVGRGDCTDDNGNVQFYTTFPASCMWFILSLKTVHRRRHKSLTRPS